MINHRLSGHPHLTRPGGLPVGAWAGPPLGTGLLPGTGLLVGGSLLPGGLLLGGLLLGGGEDGGDRVGRRLRVRAGCADLHGTAGDGAQGE